MTVNIINQKFPEDQGIRISLVEGARSTDVQSSILLSTLRLWQSICKLISDYTEYSRVSDISDVHQFILQSQRPCFLQNF